MVKSLPGGAASLDSDREIDLIRDRRVPARWRNAVGVVAGIATTTFCALVGYRHVFSGFAEFDDEGYMLVSLQGYLEGAELYDNLYSQYGPFFLQFNGSIFRLTGLAVSHDAGRMITLGMWLSVSVLALVAVVGLTRSWIIALLAQIVVFLQLGVVRNEPLHPGQLTSLLISVVIVLLVLGLTRWPEFSLFCIGALTALMLLVKLNVGALLLVALVYVALCARPGRLSALVRVGYVAFPFALMLPLLGRDGFLRFAIVVALGFASLTVWTVDYALPFSRRKLVWVPIGLILTALVVLTVAVVEGSSFSGLAHGIVLDPRTHPNDVSGAGRVVTRGIAFALAGLAAALVSRQWFTHHREASSTSLIVFSALARLAAGTYMWFMLLPDLLGGAADTGLGNLLGLAWVALVPRVGSADTREARFIRVAVCTVGMTQVLHAYPVTGSQVQFGTFLLVLVGAMCIADAAAEVRSLRELRESAWPSSARTAAAILMVVVLGVPTMLAITSARAHARQSRADYARGVQLDLPGADRVRVSRAQHDRYQALAAELARRRCTTFLTYPGLNSLYFFARSSPPTWLNAGAWPVLFDDATQQRVLDAVDEAEDICVVRFPYLVFTWEYWWTETQAGPLERYIADDFVHVWSTPDEAIELLVHER
jgi:hypothetical protein